MTPGKPYPGTQAVIRAISLLKAFTDEHPEWKLTALAQEVGLNKTTAFRLLTALESEGMVSRDADSEVYRLGLEIVTLGGRALRSNDLRSVSRPELERLAAQTHETASLEVLTGTEVMILEEIVGKHVLSGAQSIGTRWPVYATSTGKAILANLPPEHVDTILPPVLAACTAKTVSSVAELHEELDTVRSRGYAISDEELELGLVAVGAALQDYAGDTVAAISLAGPAPRMTPECIAEYGALLKETARDISARLGCRPELEE